MDFVIEPTASFTTASSFRSPNLPSNMFDSTADTMSTRRDGHFAPSSSQASFAQARRQFSEHQGPIHGQAASTDSTRLFATSYHDGSRSSNTILPKLTPHYRTPEQTPIPGSPREDLRLPQEIDNTNRAVCARDARDARDAPMQRPHLSNARRSSTNEYDEHVTRPFERNHARHLSHQPDRHYPLHLRAGFVEREPVAQYERTVHHSASAHSEFDHSPYSINPAFSMPSHHEHRHGKARKRNNLPKQSTEVMKTWFDQV